MLTIFSYDSATSRNMDIFECTICLFQTKWGFAFDQHFKMHSEPIDKYFNCCDTLKQFKCFLCDYMNYYSNVQEPSKCIHQISNFQSFPFKRRNSPDLLARPSSKFKDLPNLTSTTIMNQLPLPSNNKQVNELHFNCALCDYGPSTDEDLEVHISKHHICQYCSYTSTSQRYLRAHILRDHKTDQIRYVDKNCPVRAQTIQTLKLHSRKQLLFTPTSEQEKSQETKDNSRVRRRRYQRWYNCGRCDYATIIRKDLHVHLQLLHHGYDCQYCSFTSVSKYYLKRHMFGIHKKNNLLANLPTNSPVKTNNRLELPTSKSHSDSRSDSPSKHEISKEINDITSKGIKIGDKLFKCSHCDYLTSTEKNLPEHMKHQHQYECNYCSYFSTSKQGIRAHITGCHKLNYSLRSSLLTNTMANSKLRSRQFRCSVKNCLFKAISKNHLKLHMSRWHFPYTNSEAFSIVKRTSIVTCAICKLQFKYLDSLKAHVSVVHAPDFIKWHQCLQCSYKTKYYELLNLHISKIHGKKEVINTFFQTIFNP